MILHFIFGFLQLLQLNLTASSKLMEGFSDKTRISINNPSLVIKEKLKIHNLLSATLT